MMKVAIPGTAFQALRESTFKAEHPTVWRSALNHSETYSRRRGHFVHMDLDGPDLRTLRSHMDEMVKEYDMQTAYSLMIAVSSIDAALVHGE